MRLYEQFVKVLQYKKQVRLLKIQIMIISLCSIFASGIVLYSMFLAPPSFELVKSIGVDESGDNDVYGLYSMNNKIKVVVDSDNTLETIYHEYAHFIYHKKMSKEDRKIWDNQLCNIVSNYTQYSIKDQCTEKFAILFSNYVILDTEHNYFSPEINVFLEEMYIKHIK